MALHMGVALDGLTFSDLYGFVDLARAGKVDPKTPVEQFPISEVDPKRGIGGLDVEVALTDAGVPVTLSPDDARVLASMLDSVIEEEGDARGALDEMRQWRDRLVGLNRI